MTIAKKKRALFLDRDGVIIVDKNFQIDPNDVEFISGSINALRGFNLDLLKIMVSNQSGIARGFFTESDLKTFNAALDGILKNNGIEISAWYHCPHEPEDGCACRKPKPGMFLTAAKEFNVDLSKSWMVGDKSSDILAGKAAGTRTILVRTGYGGREIGFADNQPDFIADDLLAALEHIKSETTKLDLA